jgi:hypothetical protein
LTLLATPNALSFSTMKVDVTSDHASKLNALCE